PNPNSATNNVTCKPVSFCKWNGAKNCGCNTDTKQNPFLAINPKLKDVCEKTCKEWAVKDLDCPDDGCLCFAFKRQPSGRLRTLILHSSLVGTSAMPDRMRLQPSRVSSRLPDSAVWLAWRGFFMILWPPRDRSS